MISKKLLAIVLSLAMVIAMTPAAVFATDENGTSLEAANNELIVVYKDNAECTKELENLDFGVGSEDIEVIQELSSECAEEVVSDVGATVEESEFLGSGLGDDGAVLAITLDNKKDVGHVIDSLEKNPEVAYVQPNYEYELLDVDFNSQLDTADSLDTLATVPDDTYAWPSEGNIFQYGLFPWNYNDAVCGANLYFAWDYAKCNGAVTVAVIDSGIDMNHPDLADNIDWKHAADATCNPVKNTFITDENGHGTHVAGIIGAKAGNSRGVAGMSYNANILPIKVIDSNGRIYSTSLVRAYMYLDNLIENNYLSTLHVINMSLGGYAKEATADKLLEQAIIEMRTKHNVVTVCAGGNKHVTTRLIPGDFDSCVCVAALDYEGKHTSYTDYNCYKDISAPGGDWVFPIISTLPGGKYNTLYGTSQAAPHVSGIMALLWIVKPDLTVDQAVEAVKATAHPVNPNEVDDFTGMGSAGAIDAAAAIEYVQNKWIAQKTSINGHAIKLGNSSYTYTGLAHKPAVTVDGLTKGTDYTVTYANNVNAGQATAIVKGIGNYSGIISKKFTIKPVPITSASLSTTKYTYSGGVKRPAVTIKAKVNGKTIVVANKLTEDSLCFDLAYSTGRKAVGKHAVRVKARGNFTGTITKNFNINPKKTEIKSLKKQNKAFTVKWGKRTKQVTGYQISYSTSSKFVDSKTKTRTIKDNEVTSKKITKLKSKRTYYVKVRTYKDVGPNKHRYYSEWTKVKKVKTK